VRKAFAHAFNYTNYIQIAVVGEGIAPATAIIPGLFGYDSKVIGYSFNLSATTQLLHEVPGLWDTGFTIPLEYNTGNLARRTACELIKAAIESLNVKFHATITSIPWGTAYLPAEVRHQLACFQLGWLADFPDPHNFAVPFYASYGTFSSAQLYNNPAMDALINAGIMESDTTKRKQIYHDLQVLAVADCPSVPVLQAVGRHFERDWINGWYYNPIYPGLYAYNLWKWYYVPFSGLNATSKPPVNNWVPCDVNYNGVVNIQDVTIVALAFGSSFGPPVHARWNFRADINNDRKVDIMDITSVAINYQKTSTTWVPPT